MRPIDYFDTAAERFGTRLALIDSNGDCATFAELASISKVIASGIKKISNRRQPIIAFFSPNDYRVIVAMLGAMRAGAAVMPIHHQCGDEQVALFLRSIHPDCVFYHSQLANNVRAVRNQVGATNWICLDDHAPPDLELSSLLACSSAFTDDWSDVTCTPDRPAFVRQTSGTSGSPKIVLGDIGSFDTTQMTLIPRLATDSPPVCLVATPLSTAAGVHAFAMLSSGATLVLMRAFSCTDVLRDIAGYRVTHLWLPPTALYLLLDHPEAHSADLSSVKSIVLGGSGMAPTKLAEAVKLFGSVISITYSQVESGLVTWLDSDTIKRSLDGEHSERLVSSGRSVLTCRIAIMDDGGQLMSATQVGEIVLRGRAIKPYIRGCSIEPSEIAVFEYDSTEMADSRRRGWHHTGDVGYLDDAGYLYVIGRKKDIVNTAGYKVFATDIERAILTFPGICECAAIAVPDETRGEAVKAIITTRQGVKISTKAVIAYCRGKLGSLHMPRTVEIWDELPKNAAGKIDKQLLLRRYWGESHPFAKQVAVGKTERQ